MSTNIAQNGGTILLRQDGSDIQYSSEGSNVWTTISVFPIWITNSSPSSSNILTVKLTTDITITNVNCYFVCKSTYITFDGQNYTITMSNVANYYGLIGNTNYRNIIVKNIITTTSGTSSLYSGGGWICQFNFGSGGGCINLEIDNCKNYGPISNNSGGICGQQFCQNNASGKITNCINYGAITNGGGIVGYRVATNLGNVIIDNCRNEGTVTGGWGSGGITHILGDSCKITITNCSNISDGSAGIVLSTDIQSDSANGQITITDCYNTGYINGGGGICGGSMTGNITVRRCYSTGNMNHYSGGIFGERAGTFLYNVYTKTSNIVVSDCYSTGSMLNHCGGIFAGDACDGGPSRLPNTILVENCYSTGNMNGMDCGGIFGKRAGARNGRITVNNCFSAGNMLYNGCGGIFAVSAASYAGGPNGYGPQANDGGIVTINNCYSRGTIASNTGGICGRYAATDNGSSLVVTNCYSSGLISGVNPIGIFGTNKGSAASFSNCYVANNSWSDSDANANLTGVPSLTPGIGTIWVSVDSANSPYFLLTIAVNLFPKVDTVLSNFNNLTIGLGETFNITNPTSNSPAPFVYTSSNTSVALAGRINPTFGSSTTAATTQRTMAFAVSDDGNTRVIAHFDNSSISFSKYNGSSWSSYVTLTNSEPFSGNYRGCCLTSGGLRGILTSTGGYCYFFTWNGTTYTSITRTLDTNTRNYGGVDVTSNGSRIVTVADGQVYFATWNGTNYNAFVSTGLTLSSSQDVCITSDGSKIAISDGFSSVYWASWNGTTYVNPIKINGAGGNGRRVRFLNGDKMLVYAVQGNSSGSIQYSLLDDAGYTSFIYVPSTVIPAGLDPWGFAVDSNSIYLISWPDTSVYKLPITNAANVTGFTRQIKVVGSGTVTITATQNETIGFKQGSISCLLTVSKANPRLLSIDSNVVGGTDQFKFISTSNAAFSYTFSDTSVVQLNGNGTFSFLNNCSVLVTAHQDESNDYFSGDFTSVISYNKLN